MTCRATALQAYSSNKQAIGEELRTHHAASLLCVCRHCSCPRGLACASSCAHICWICTIIRTLRHSTKQWLQSLALSAQPVPSPLHQPNNVVVCKMCMEYAYGTPTELCLLRCRPGRTHGGICQPMRAAGQPAGEGRILQSGAHRPGHAPLRWAASRKRSRLWRPRELCVGMASAPYGVWQASSANAASRRVHESCKVSREWSPLQASPWQLLLKGKGFRCFPTEMRELCAGRFMQTRAVGMSVSVWLLLSCSAGFSRTGCACTSGVAARVSL